MYLQRLFLTFSFCFIFSFGSFAQVRISGVLLDATTTSPVPWANVLITGTEKGTVTSVDGTFSIVVEELPVSITFSHIAFQDTTVEVTSSDYLKLKLKPAILSGEEVQVTSTRAIPGKTPVAFTQLNRSDIRNVYYQQDVPMLLAEQVGVYAYSDAGNGIGYTYVKIRGFQQDRIGVLFNGIPLNDPEAHAVYWVDHGDLLASTGEIQIQRGVGNSLYGTSVFGGSINLATDLFKLSPGLKLTAGYGNYTGGLNLPSRKFSLQYNNSVPLAKNWRFLLRFSDLNSEGYRIGSGTRQRSFHLAAQRDTRLSTTRIEVLRGDEVTAFSWEGIIPYYGYDLKDRQQRRYNYYADPYFNGGRDNANRDVFTQKIFLIQHGEKLGSLLFHLSLYNVQGDGYYEQFKGGRDLAEYNLTTLITDTNEVDLVRRKWLKNGYRGAVYQFSLPLGESFDLTLGGDLRFYRARHFGEVKEVDGDYQIPAGHKYYNNRSWKDSYSFYLHTIWDISSRLRFMFDLRSTNHIYQFNQGKIGIYDGSNDYKLKWNFLDPHLGLYYKVSEAFSLFGNISTAHREPSDNDIYDQDEPEASPAIQRTGGDYDKSLFKDEFLVDYELGFSLDLAALSAKLNLFRMDFQNEIVPVEYRYYDADDVLHANAPKTLHQGVELQLNWIPVKRVELSTNATFSDNHFVEFTGDALGWSGWGGSYDYAGKKVPAFPSAMVNAKFTYKSLRLGDYWIGIHYAGKQYIDFKNTEDAAIDPYTLVNCGFNYSYDIGEGKAGPFRISRLEFSFRVNNLFDVLYETFGYNYYEDPETRVDAYWPGATRNYYFILSLVY